MFSSIVNVFAPEINQTKFCQNESLCSVRIRANANKRLSANLFGTQFLQLRARTVVSQLEQVPLKHFLGNF